MTSHQTLWDRLWAHQVAGHPTPYPGLRSAGRTYVSNTQCGSKDAPTSSYAVVIWNHSGRLAALLPDGGIRYLTWSGRSQVYDALREGDAVTAYFTPGWQGATHAVEKFKRKSQYGVTDDVTEEKEDAIEEGPTPEAAAEVGGAGV